ncbi:glycosyltransferase family 2 protein [Halomonas urumqiensis]|uniref:Glycosyltransferase n=1 Tax=Halomonas urumqiensis TaxID=1684789 RepID=A0A2N7UK37_9GAMM|nr:glycosyltransferase family 2 protein [Halomonas urumqiensis]PMR80804.1 glycosyltransferase [Halomonas urumqiensis]PTB02761.1 glycosyltransferase family 2 protein [Halomonas urumqiensis]GHE21262.1 glycosyl transferase [Halomonas urumqiensis]
MSIAAVLIVKNEQAHLRACLEALSWADEIVILDAGSQDGSQEIAREFTDKVVVNDDWQGFGVQRQRAEALVESEWILMVDADERVTPALRESIQAALDEGTQAIYTLPRLSWCFGAFIRHSGWYPDRVARLYPRGRAGYDDALVHEKLRNPHALPVKPLEGDLLHFTYRDLRHYLEKSAHYAEAWAEQRVARGKRGSLADGLLHGVGCFVRMYLLKAGFLDGRQGLLLALLSAHSTFAKYADLWVRTRTPAPPQDASAGH